MTTPQVYTFLNRAAAVDAISADTPHAALLQAALDMPSVIDRPDGTHMLIVTEQLRPDGGVALSIAVQVHAASEQDVPHVPPTSDDALTVSNDTRTAAAFPDRASAEAAGWTYEERVG